MTKTMHPDAFDPALKDTLVAGTQLYALTEEFFNSDPTKYCQKPGDIVQFNSAKYNDIVGGHGVNGVSYTGRSTLGLGVILKDGTYRLATPDDPGYLGTKELWHDHMQREIKDLRSSLLMLSLIALTALGALAFYPLKSIGAF